MINIDAILLDFVRTNIVTISLFLAVLKVIAIYTPWAVDDKIIEIFFNFFDRKFIKKEK